MSGVSKKRIHHRNIFTRNLLDIDTNYLKLNDHMRSLCQKNKHHNPKYLDIFCYCINLPCAVCSWFGIIFKSES